MLLRFFRKLFGRSKPPIPKNKPDDIQARSDEFNAYQKKALKEIDVLARTLWGESRSEGIKGMEAVAAVILNRVAVAQKNKKYWWGSTIIDVCLKPYQFSCWNKDDPSYPKLVKTNRSNAYFRQALMIAEAAVNGDLKDPTFGATHYHANYVSPYWAKGEKPTIIIGNHLFFKLV